MSGRYRVILLMICAYVVGAFVAIVKSPWLVMLAGSVVGWQADRIACWIGRAKP